jgi:DNA-binding beta-propeller fold protein YncE
MSTTGRKFTIRWITNRHFGFKTALFLSSCLFALLLARPGLAQGSGSRPAYRSPSDVAYAPDGSFLAVADRTWPGLVLIKPGDGTVAREIKLLGDPTHVVWNGADKVLVDEGGNGSVAEIDVSSGTVLRRIPVGLVAQGLALTSDGARLLICDRAANKLVVVKLASGVVESVIDVGREPGTVAVSKDGKLAIVGNKLPRPFDMMKGLLAAEISIVDLGSGQVTAVPLAKPATMVRHVVLSPDGKWAYVTHQLPRGGLPITQLDNGWVMVNAMSIIDIGARTLYANMIFDRSGFGAAHPWSAAINADGSKLWVSLEGVRQVATVDLTALHDKLASMSATQRLDLSMNLVDLHTSGIINRTALSNIDGPRGVSLSPDGKTLAVAAYFTGKVLLLAPDDLSVIKAIALPDNPAEDLIRKGERAYHSAMACYQNWLSCSSCHDEGRADGLNRDLMDDGTGNPKQTKSNILASETPPSTITGCRENAEVFTRALYSILEFQSPTEEQVQATYAFIKSLAPEPSPFLGSDGQLTPDAVEGKKLFEGQAGCAACHKGQYFTDMQKHDVGTRYSGSNGPDNNPAWDSNGWDTPTLIEVWRSAPYLHLGTALTVKDAILTHVKTSELSAQQIDLIAAYVMQIGPTREKALPQPVMADAGVPADAPVAPAGADAGVPMASDTPLSADAAGGSTGGSVGSGGSATVSTGGGMGGKGGTAAVSSGPAGQGGGGGGNETVSSGPVGGGTGANPDAPPAERGDASTQGSVTLTRGGASCHVGSASSSQGGSVLLLVGLAWLSLARRRSTTSRSTAAEPRHARFGGQPAAAAEIPAPSAAEKPGRNRCAPEKAGSY